MEIKMGCAPFSIYKPYATHIMDQSRLLMRSNHKPEPVFWYAGRQYAYLEGGSLLSLFYTGPVAFREITALDTQYKVGFELP